MSAPRLDGEPTGHGRGKQTTAQPAEPRASDQLDGRRGRTHSLTDLVFMTELAQSATSCGRLSGDAKATGPTLSGEQLGMRVIA